MKKRLLKKILSITLTGTMGMALIACGSGSDSDKTNPAESGKTSDPKAVTISFQQWWEPELPEGVLADIAKDFTEETGINVELLSNPYADTKTQIAAGAATGTMADVIGLDGAWVYDFGEQEAIANLSDLLKEDGYDDSQIVSQVQYKESTYMIPIVNFANPMYVNLDLLEAAGVSDIPSNWSEFLAACDKVVNNTDAAAFAIPLSAEAPNGIQNQVMTWLWASGGSMLKDGMPNLEGNAELEKVVDLVKTMYDKGYLAAGAEAMQEEDMTNEFINGRLAFMMDGISHLGTIREGAPDMNLDVMTVPVTDNYTGRIGMIASPWGVGISANSAHQKEAVKFVEYLLNPEVNARLVAQANGFPGNTGAKPDYCANDELFVKLYEMSKDCDLVNEFLGAPVAESLMRDFNKELVLYLDGDIASSGDMLKAAQADWEPEYK